MSDTKTDNYKNTLNLPETSFPMKANLSEKEQTILKKWQEDHLYETVQSHNSHNKKKPTFILHSGPPYANGDSHIGHAVNYTLKDIVVKSKVLSGFSSPFVPGWDCHGLPVELNVEKQVGKAGVKIEPKEFRAACRQYVDKQIEAQKNTLMRLGVLADWKNPYLTMDFQYEADTVRSLAKIIQNGYLHKGYKPVHWCIDCGSALAEAEVEYKDKTSPSIHVCFTVIDNHCLPFQQNQQHPIHIVIWTTTPWTLPANEAVALHPEFSYVLFKINNLNNSNLNNVNLSKDKQNPCFIVAEKLLPSFLKLLNIEPDEIEVLDKTLGQTLEGVLLQHPFYDKQVPIVLGGHVTLEAGTGCVHTAPAHGQDDFLIGNKYQLPLDNPVGGNGCYVPGTPLFAGEHVFKANEKVIAVLRDQHKLLIEEKVQHSYPHCWRHKSPLIFRATQQWFIGMDQKALRESAIRAIQGVTWIPQWGQARIESMIEGRPDWCISRQRTWGVPLCLILIKATGDLHPNMVSIMEKVAKAIEKSGIDAWYDIPLADLIGVDENPEDYEKSLDTLDVWFDSGVSHFCVLEKRPELTMPADLYLEGSDQHRGWFQSSLLTSVAMNAEAPYRQVLTHGFTVDADGHKMSKSLGNTVAPEKIFKSLGADILRLWVASTDYRNEMSVSEEILKRTSDTYRRIRNTARFLLANLHDFDPHLHQVKGESLLALDSFMLAKARNLQDKIIKAYSDYQFHVVYQEIHNFCSIDLGSFYLDIIKDRQYTGKKDGIPRRSAQTVMYHIIEALVRWMAPILSYTAEEIWQHMPGKRETSSVFLSEWYQLPGFKEKEGMEEKFWQDVKVLREGVNKALELARTTESGEKSIGSGLEAEVALYCDPNHYATLDKLKEELRFLLITSKASIFPRQDLERQEKSAYQLIYLHELEANQKLGLGLVVGINPSKYPKCVRCWHRVESVDKNTEYPGLCIRCIENVEGKGEKREYV